MTRIQPKCFIECYKHGENNIEQYKFWILADYYPENKCTENTVAVFLVQEVQTTLTERLEARKVNNNLNQ
jgi:hypothetical protein